MNDDQRMIPRATDMAKLLRDVLRGTRVGKSRAKSRKLPRDWRAKRASRRRMEKLTRRAQRH